MWAPAPSTLHTNLHTFHMLLIKLRNPPIAEMLKPYVLSKPAAGFSYLELVVRDFFLHPRIIRRRLSTQWRAIEVTASAALSDNKTNRALQERCECRNSVFVQW